MTSKRIFCFADSSIDPFQSVCKFGFVVFTFGCQVFNARISITLSWCDDYNVTGSSFQMLHCYLLCLSLQLFQLLGIFIMTPLKFFLLPFPYELLSLLRVFWLHFPNESFPCSCVHCFRFWHFSYWFVENSFRVNILGIISIVCFLCMCLMGRLDYFKEVLFLTARIIRIHPSWDARCTADLTLAGPL